MSAPAMKPLPCPFCGRKPTHRRHEFPGRVWHIVWCANVCYATPSVSGGTEAEAVRRWNRRAK